MADDMEKPKKAVALKYEAGQDQAPVVVAKGQGQVAEAILRMARAEGVPVTENPPVVEILARLELGEEIPPELYRAVAEIMAFVCRLEGTRPK